MVPFTEHAYIITILTLTLTIIAIIVILVYKQWSWEEIISGGEVDEFLFIWGAINFLLLLPTTKELIGSARRHKMATQTMVLLQAYTIFIFIIDINLSYLIIICR